MRVSHRNRSDGMGKICPLEQIVIVQKEHRLLTSRRECPDP